MAVANQKTYLGWAVSPNGRRLVYQAGTANFGTNTTEATLTVHIRRLVYGQCTTNNPPVTGSKTGMLCGVLPYVSATQYTQNLGNYRVVVERKTAGGALATASRFSYLLIGY